MIPYVLDASYNTLDIIDNFTEVIWTERYRDCGDFELYLPVQMCRNANLAKGNYLRIKESEDYMIIEDTTTTTGSTKEDPMFKIIGRDLGSILDRRVIWDQIDFTGTVHNLIKKILTDNIISPSNTNRRIPNFTFIDSSGGRMGETITIQLHGENVLTIIKDLCEEYGLGFRVRPVGAGGFSFQLYDGADRSYAQNVNPWVVFSPKYENLEATTLVENQSGYKNTACVFNEYTKRYQVQTVETKTDSGGYTYDDTITTTYEVPIRSEVEVYNDLGSVSGLARREIFIESNKSHTKDDGENTEYTEQEYNEILRAEGKESLAEYEMTAVFSGKIEAYRQFILHRDFQLGDIISIENEYGQKGRCRVIEAIYHHGKTGESILPTFENVDDSKITNS